MNTQPYWITCPHCMHSWAADAMDYNQQDVTFVCQHCGKHYLCAFKLVIRATTRPLEEGGAE